MKFSKKTKLAAGIAGAAVAAAALYYFAKKENQLDVTLFENAILSKFPNAKITDIQKTSDDSDIYTVTLEEGGEMRQIYVTAQGNVIEPSPGGQGESEQ